MAGRRQPQEASSEIEDNDVENLTELVRQDDQKQPSEEERREVRNVHARIRDELIAAQDGITGKGLQDMLDTVEHNFSRVQTPREAIKDAENIKLLSEMHRQRMQAYDLNLVRFLPEEFAANLKQYCVVTLRSQVDRDVLSAKSWSMLGQHCQPYFRTSPALHFMLGSFERGEVVKKVASERKPRDNEPGKITELKQLESFKETSRNEATTKEVEDVLQTLWHHYERNDRRLRQD